MTMNEPIILDLGAMRFVLDAADGLKALRWENRLTGRILDLGGGPEVAFDIGLPDQPLSTPKLRVTGLPTAAQADCGNKQRDARFSALRDNGHTRRRA